jgi:hypothetical protein
MLTDPAVWGHLAANLSVAVMSRVAASRRPAGRRAATLDRYWSVRCRWRGGSESS